MSLSLDPDSLLSDRTLLFPTFHIHCVLVSFDRNSTTRRHVLFSKSLPGL